MNSQLPLKQIELKNNRLFTLIIVCSTIFSVFNFLLNYYLIKSLSVNVSGVRKLEVLLPIRQFLNCLSSFVVLKNSKFKFN